MPVFVSGQSIEVSTILKDVNASGGMTLGPDGNLYISDFGKSFPDSALTSAYKIEWNTWKVSVFATGFMGASGNCFDHQGNFYQSNPKGNKISKISPDGEIVMDWATQNLKTPIGLVADEDDNIYVCNCGSNNISKVDHEGRVSLFAESDLFKCPNGLTRDPRGNLYACNFNDGKVLKITPEGEVSVFVELPELQGSKSNLGNGHLVWKNNFLFVATIGTGEIFKVDPKGNAELITGRSAAFSNIDGIADSATFSKPNAIVASTTGDTLFVNVSEPTWKDNPLALHPENLRMITGIRSLKDFDKEFVHQDLNGLLWILGKWDRTDLPEEKTGFETWKKISDTEYSGEALRMENGKIAFKEELSLKVKDNEIYYGAYVDENKKWVYYKLSSLGEDYFHVENLSHDFPKEISYILGKNKDLKARISGDGHSIDFSFRRE